ncbi:uncharacterized protein EDB93DRAFT_1099111 [Suillus bovinus]|uniref:uncharacterized protein n=1 Tax=Suillus bovinus TaxID=48563 RepID=UPI001B8730FB|nr:uncharacterized protein EDB93DRAFT_1099111 [Suillus bovinus]KAG2159582.1 hypothetical protein EDB93DRAFT_1099111 [Suillus bovinus]
MVTWAMQKLPDVRVNSEIAEYRVQEPDPYSVLFISDRVNAIVVMSSLQNRHYYNSHYLAVVDSHIGAKVRSANIIMTSDRTTGQPGPEVLDMRFPPGHELNFHHSLDPVNSSSNFLAVDHQASCSVNEISLEDSPFDMGFNALPVQHEHPAQMPLDMGFGINPVDHLRDQSVDIELEDRPLDMGFGVHPVHDFLDQSYIQPDNVHLDMGFETLNPVQVLPDQSLGELEPIGFVIQRAVGDLRLVIHWLEMERAQSTMSLEESQVSWEVLHSTNELLLAFQLISIYRLST